MVDNRQRITYIYNITTNLLEKKMTYKEICENKTIDELNKTIDLLTMWLDEANKRTRICKPEILKLSRSLKTAYRVLANKYGA